MGHGRYTDYYQANKIYAHNVGQKQKAIRVMNFTNEQGMNFQVGQTERRPIQVETP